MSLIEYLPAIYQDPSDGAEIGAGQFLFRFLWAFERVLLSGAPLAPPADEAGGKSAGFSGRQPGHGATTGLSADTSYREAGPTGSEHLGEKQRPDRAPSPLRGPLGSRGEGRLIALEDEISGLWRYFQADTAPEEFLPWLANWVALALRADMPPARQRRLLANAARLYRIRGTRRGLEEVLKLYLDAMPSVNDDEQPSFQILDHSTVGSDTVLGGGTSFSFEVRLAFAVRDKAFVSEQMQLAREVLDLERPAHTSCQIIEMYPRMQVGVQSTVGVETVLKAS